MFVEVDREVMETSESRVVEIASTSMSPKRDFDALISWLSTFPQMMGHSYDCSNIEAVLNDDAFAM